ncbi:hypothetical protein CSIM01_05363 [Colletotrichum simmondsii]|uniref:Ankyrin repeat protein n=1 Tax=Colletotrichum simmondsii TaxID=703756 RepID=A0A135TGW6_9PEZI|nr:hypothetical protein CSIM01_05363 [Colletotrichum simmondsii]
MKSLTFFERLRRKGRVKNDAVVANPGLSSIASSNASLIKPSQASVHSRLLEKPTIPAASELYELRDKPEAEDPGHLKHEQIAERLNEKVEELSQERLTISIGSRELAIEPMFKNVSKHIVAARDLISSAAGAEPHAALACAGGLVVLTVGSTPFLRNMHALLVLYAAKLTSEQFLVRPIEQREHILRGLELTSSLICRYFAMEQVYRSRARLESLSAEPAKKLELNLEQSLINLYTNIIEFQARALCYLHRSRSTRFIRDMFRGNTWKDLIEEIGRLDANCRAVANLVTDEKILTFIESHSQKVEQAIINVNAPQTVSFDLLRRRTELLRNLYACPYRDRKDVNPERAPGTCEWFTEHDYFRDWMSAADSRILRVSADPGCGKSVLSKYLVDDVLPSTSVRTTCYFFFKDDFEDQKRASIAMRCILRQIFEQTPDLMDEETVAKFEAAGDNLSDSFPSLFEILLEVSIRVETELICLFDALDECNAQDCRQITSALSKFYMKPTEGSRLKFIITSRPYIQIQRSLQRLETSIPTIHLRGDDESQLKKISGEIDIVIRHRVKSIAEVQLLEPHEIELLEQSLSNSDHRTYLWVKLALDFIEDRLESPTKESIQSVLSSVPEKLDGLYEKILDRSPNKEQARKVLQIIIGAFKPLTLGEMSTALCIKKEHKSFSEIGVEPAIRNRSYLRQVCGLFVTIVGGRVYLLHETARAFLIQGSEHLRLDTNVEWHKMTWLHSITLRESSIVMAKACVWLLCIRNAAISRGEHTVALNWNRTDESWVHFERYAVWYGLDHFKALKGEDLDSFADEVVYLCKSDVPGGTSFLDRHVVRAYHHPKGRFDTGFDSLASDCVYIGNARECPLFNIIINNFDWAASKLLTEDPKAGRRVDWKGTTALWWAAWAGQAHTVRLLLAYYDDVEYGDIALNGGHSTPLSVAIAHKHNDAAHALLQDPRTSLTTRCYIRRNWTPIHYAIAAHNLEFVELLLADKRPFVGWTSADFADLVTHSIKWGNLETIDFLLSDKRFDFGSSDSKTWRTQFCHLANPMDNNELRPSFPENDRLDLMEYLVETLQVDFAKSDRGGRSPVSWASSRPENVETLSYLLRPPSKKKVKMTKKKASKAASLLLDYGADFTLRDMYGRTALMYAARDGLAEAIRALIECGAEVNDQDIHGRTALSYAAEGWYVEPVGDLLKARADASLCDNQNRLPCWWAKWLDRARASGREVYPLREDDMPRTVSLLEEGCDGNTDNGPH